jgi:hypothetical protein
VAHSEREQLRASGHAEDAGSSRTIESGEKERERIWIDVGERGPHVADTTEQGFSERFDANITGSTWWSTEPDVGRLADGVSDRVGKLRCLGNAIVPQVAYQLIKRMIEAEGT